MLSNTMITSALGAWVFLSTLAVQFHIPSASAIEPPSSTLPASLGSPFPHAVESPNIPLGGISSKETDEEEVDQLDLRPHRFLPVKIEQHHKQSSHPPQYQHRSGVVPAPESAPRPVESNLLGDAGYDLEEDILHGDHLAARDAEDIHHPTVEDRDPGIIRVDRVDGPYDHHHQRHQSHHLNPLAGGNEFRPELGDDKYARPVIQKPPKPPKRVPRPRPEAGSCGSESGSGCGFAILGRDQDADGYEDGHGLVSRADHDPFVDEGRDELADGEDPQAWLLKRDAQLQRGHLADADADSSDSESAGVEIESDFDSEAEVEFDTRPPRPGIQSRVVATPGEYLDLLSDAVKTPTTELKAGDVAFCRRSNSRIHMVWKWSITYKGDSAVNGMHCGSSVLQQLRRRLRCRPILDWTCVRSGREGEDQVTMEFRTLKTCVDSLVHDAVKKATDGKVDVWCLHK